jgi:ABC-type multidrug transport system fused ATPase/permease subunit
VKDRQRVGITSFVGGIYGRTFALVVLLVGVTGMIAAGAQMLQIIYMGRIIDGVERGFDYVLPLFLVIVAAMIIHMAFNTLWAYTADKHTSRLMTRLREKLTHTLCYADFAALETLKDGDILSIVTSDAEGIRSWARILFQLGFVPIQFGFALAACFLISWKMAAIALPLAPLILGLGMVFSADLYQFNLQEKAGLGKLNGFLSDTMNFMIVIKTYCLEGLFAQRNRDNLDHVVAIRKRVARRNGAVTAFNTSMGHLAFVVIFLTGSLLVVSEEIAIGDMIAFIFLANFMGDGINILQAIPGTYRNACAAQHRLEQLMSLPDEDCGDLGIKRDAGSLSPGDLFAFKQVSFAYNADAMGLHNVSFSIKQGEKIAILGMSGSGKSTLFKLMCGLYRPTDGTITYRGENVADMPAVKLRRDLAVAPQESFLLLGTIANNIRIGRPDATEEEVIHACRKAQIHDFVVGLPQGYATELRNIGKIPSRGQMQRLNLARALLKDAPVLLLDEPTSALDISTHNAVMHHLTQELSGKTMIIIIHRLTRPERFDKIIVMEEGRIAGFGHHDHLTSSCTSYPSMLGKLSEQCYGVEVGT